MEDKIAYGIIGILTVVLAGFGGYMFLDQETIDNTYVCSTNEEVGTFTRLSSTSKTGYYPDPTNIEKELSKVCRNGQWISLTKYAESKGVSVIEFLQQKEIISNVVISTEAPKEICNTEGCVRQ